MLKVKIFAGSSVDLEKKINDWLQSQERIDVVQMTQSTSSVTTITIIIILYRDGGS